MGDGREALLEIRADLKTDPPTAASSVRALSLRRALLVRLLLASGFAMVTGSAWGQRADDNAIVQAGDAFGTQVGSERTGVYNDNSVRGFDPTDLGNARVSGLYFDQVNRLPRVLTERSTIRVGISAQGFAFAAPTGLVDYSIHAPGDESLLSLDLQAGSNHSRSLTAEFETPLSGSLAAGGGYHVRSSEFPRGRRSWSSDGALIARWRPYERAQVVSFGVLSKRGDTGARPVFYVDGDDLPPRIDRRRDLSQPWSGRDSRSSIFGTLIRLPWRTFSLEAGLFRDKSVDASSFSDLHHGVATDGSVRERVIIADGDRKDQSLSGEVRLVRRWGGANLRHTATVSLRGRHKQRQFGSGRRLSLGASTVNHPDLRPEPEYSLGPGSHDDVRQFTYGVAYGLMTRSGGSLDLGVSQSDYRKKVDFADEAVRDVTTETSPVLWNVSGAYPVTKSFTLFAGMSRGVEEALIAPESAANRSEAPPAILSEQKEAGARIKLAQDLTVVAGVFRLSKPYFNLDSQKLYRRLGSITVEGVELSLAGRLMRGLSLVAGTVLMNPGISGEAVDSAQIGPDPIGQVRRRSVLNLDWRPGGGVSPWSLDMTMESLGAVTANATNSLTVPARTNIDLGTRYRFSIGRSDMLLRLRVSNLFNKYSWQVSRSGGLTFVEGRSATLQLIADL